MSAPAFDSVDDYIHSKPPSSQVALTTVRAAIREALPTAKETISYNIPTYKVDGRAVIFFAGWKNHYSIYPASKALLAAFETQLGACKVVNSTLQFRFDKQVPFGLIRSIAEFKAVEVAE